MMKLINHFQDLILVNNSSHFGLVVTYIQRCFLYISKC